MAVLIGKFKELDVIINKFIEIILRDQELCKLIKYNEDPLLQSDFNTRSLMYNNVFPLPKKPDAETKKCTILDVYFSQAHPWTKNTGFKQEFIVIDIICHLDVWDTGDGLRPYLISQRLDELFNDQHITGVSLSNVYFDDWSLKVYSDYFYGYRMIYMLTNNSNLMKKGSGV